MNTWIALLRGINVGGNTIIKMDALRQCFNNMGFSNVRTYIQTGNVLFKSAEPGAEQLKTQIEQEIAKTFKLNVAVIILHPQQLADALKNCPSQWHKPGESTKYYVTFLNRPPDTAKWKKLLQSQAAGESNQLHGNQIYTSLTPQAVRPAFASSALEKKLGVTGTTRNWKVVQKIAKLASAP